MAQSPSTPIQGIVFKLAALRADERWLMDDEAIAAWVDREKEPVAELARTPAVTQGDTAFEDAGVKADEVGHLLTLGDFADLWADLTTSLAADAVAIRDEYDPLGLVSEALAGVEGSV